MPLEVKFLMVSPEDIVWQPGNNIRIDMPPGGGSGSEVVIVTASAFDDSAVTVSVEDTTNMSAPSTFASETPSGSEMFMKKEVQNVASTANSGAASAGDASPRSASSENENLEKLTVPVLKAMAKEYGLPVSGRKAEIVSRLKQHLEANHL